jgi:hypothetical protein
VIPEHPSQIEVVDVDLDHLRHSYLRHALDSLPTGEALSEVDLEFLVAETRSHRDYVLEVIDEIHRKAR